MEHFLLEKFGRHNSSASKTWDNWSIKKRRKRKWQENRERTQNNVKKQKVKHESVFFSASKIAVLKPWH